MTHTDEEIVAQMERALWEFIDTAGKFPRLSPNDQIWGHVLAYMPDHIPLPKFVTDPRDV